MTPILVEGPAVEPVSLEEMRLYLRLDHPMEDTLVLGLVKAARLAVEAASRRLLVAQRWRLVLDRWPHGRVLRLPLSPLLAVEAIRVTDAAGVAQVISPSLYTADAVCDPPRLDVSLAPDPGVPLGGIAVDCLAGFGEGAEAVPEPLRLALKILVARWFESRGDAAAEPSLPPEAMALLAPYRRARL